MKRKNSSAFADIIFLLGMLSLLCITAPTQGARIPPDVASDLHHDHSPKLRNFVPPPHVVRPNEIPFLGRNPNAPSSNAPDPVVQSSAKPSVKAPTPGPININGVGLGFSGPQGTFTVDRAPSDSNGAVGATQYVQWVNTSFAVFNKNTGNVVYGPVPGNTLWQGFGGACETNNDGDPIVEYDQAANRWVMTQFAARNGPPFLQCVAVSTSSDATGSYHRYAFEMPAFNDYTKLGVWPDAYYASTNLFSGTAFLGARICAFERSAMLNGNAASQICFSLPNADSLLPADLDGSRPPPTGAPNYLLNLGSNSLNLWKFHANFVTPANSTLTGPTNIPVAGFTGACSATGGICIRQSGTFNSLDALSDRLMHRLAYRNFGDHESLVVNHSVSASTVGADAGVRWYELRNPGGTPLLFQQGTYAPDSNSRWMGSIAMDQAGDIALGYSVSSRAMYPAIRFTGRVPGDASNTLQAESSLIEGTGSQTSGLARWGDYSGMSVDPIDDCTFWYTNQFIKTNGSFNWSTRIGAFRFPNCSGAPNFSIAATPTSKSVPQVPGASTTYAVTIAASGGFTGTVNLTASGLPAGVTANFTPPSIETSGNSTLTVTTDGTTPLGTYSLTLTGTSGNVSHTTSVQLTVTAPFAITATPASQTVPRGGNTTYTVSVMPSSGFNGAVNLSVNGLPSGTTASFNPNPISNGTSTLTVTAGSATPLGSYTLTITGSSGGVSDSTTVLLTVTAPFSITATPASRTIQQGANTTYTVTVTPSSGFNSAVNLSVSGLPSGATANFNPNPISSGSSTLTVAAGSATPPGSYTVTITGTSGSVSDSTTVALNVVAPTSGDFTISATPSSRSVARGRFTNYTVTVTPSGGFSGAVGLSVSGLPSGTTASFNPNPINTSGSATLLVKTSRQTPKGSYTLTIQGTSGNLAHTATVNLSVF